jgi:carbohydrate kinase (thermoresistant glucokinase family)
MGTLVVVAGAMGAGKSTVGALLAAQLQLRFVDADSLHSPENIAKMAKGAPLTDDERQPWLLTIAALMRENRSAGLIVACSALKRSFRDVITQAAPTTFFIALQGSPEVLRQRLAGRSGHFMPMQLLESQLATLEELQPDERGVTLSIDQDLEAIVSGAYTAISQIADASGRT